jgi:simple sugar transport system permease protein
MLELAAPLIICSLGTVIAFRAGQFTLGGEGQLYAGACLAALAGSSPLFAGILPSALGLLLCMVAGAAGGALVALFSALGKRFADADVLLTSFLLSQAAILVIDALIGGGLRDQSNNLVAMAPIAPGFLLHRIARPSALTIAPIIAVSLTAVFAILLDRTKFGKMLSIYGRNQVFARIQGFPVETYSWLPMLVSGAMHGLAGACMALGVNGTAIRGMSGGVGWSAIGVALIAANKPAAIPISALIFVWLDAGARQSSVLSDIPYDISVVIKALVVIAITARPVFRKLRSLRMAKGSPA